MAVNTVSIHSSVSTSTTADGDHTTLAVSTVIGGPGEDEFATGPGDDLIDGRGGPDRLSAGGGTDTLIGGDGPDVFVYEAVADSPAGPGKDTIRDFDPAADRLDLSGLDADPSAPGNQAFTFIGVAPLPATPGTLRYDAGEGIVQGNLDHDPAPEFAVLLLGNPPLDVSDFLL